jgi:hypothetical protein
LLEELKNGFEKSLGPIPHIKYGKQEQNRAETRISLGQQLFLPNKANVHVEYFKIFDSLPTFTCECYMLGTTASKYKLLNLVKIII